MKTKWKWTLGIVGVVVLLGARELAFEHKENQQRADADIFRQIDELDAAKARDADPGKGARVYQNMTPAERKLLHDTMSEPAK